MAVTILSDTLQELALLLAESQTIAAPYDAQIHALQIARADATASVQFAIETLQATIRPLLLAEGHTVKHNRLTATVVHKETWDNALLRTFAEEVPAVLQCLRDSSYVTFRLGPGRR